ncbi:N-acetylglucosamine-1-phosphate uridyltransferase / Glucosamine-1-phosphate N-acetyltransferase [hydrothermal vent metagenome]|uniref:N-acetylglucosamine-1-phosphate uridyltransferase / Glucosamine-1-phosphate N-acetyltransferase n=1 Tax=hydrothermal vent metagenome TaxID=652676 RepID=A0A3B0ZBU1_9ZZZZ
MSLHIVILAAGQGTRMRSARAKVLHELAGRSLLKHVIDTAQNLKAEAIHVVIGHDSEQVTQCLKNEDVHWVMQSQRLGTGHAVAQVMPDIADGNVVLVLYGDVPLIQIETLIELLKKVEDGALGLLTVALPDSSGYGRIVRNEAGVVQKIVEHKDASELELEIKEVNTGILAAPAAELKKWLRQLKNNNQQQEYYLTDIIAMAVNEGLDVKTATPTSIEEVSGINDRAQLAVLERHYQLQQAKDLMLQGVTLADPARIEIRGELGVGIDSEIDINCIFQGKVKIGKNSKISSNVLIINSIIGNNVEILANTVIEDAVIGDQCRIGPFARIRPETELSERVYIGNFVEIKKTTINKDSKINHLSYVGDAEIGRGVNIGAGTITCNYDGANKHKTLIGNNVFVGSNTQLIAPVKVNDNATIAAGTTVTKNVEDGALAISRVPQKMKLNWQRPSKKK